MTGIERRIYQEELIEGSLLRASPWSVPGFLDRKGHELARNLCRIRRVAVQLVLLV
jgi:hypothetical protein